MTSETHKKYFTTKPQFQDEKLRKFLNNLSNGFHDIHDLISLFYFVNFSSYFGMINKITK